MKRDLVGYGKNPPRVEWPGGCQIAVSLVVNYEEGSELTPVYGDKRHETNGEIPSRKPPEARSLQTETQWDTEGEQGVGDWCACSRRKKEKQRSSPVPWRWNKTQPSARQIIPPATTVAGP